MHVNVHQNVQIQTIIMCLYFQFIRFEITHQVIKGDFREIYQKNLMTTNKNFVLKAGLRKLNKVMTIIIIKK